MRIERNECGLHHPSNEIKNGVCSSCARGKTAQDNRKIEAIMLTTETTLSPMLFH